MKKLTREFIINYPLTKTVVRDLKWVTERVGELTITGTAYCYTNYSKIDVENRYSVDVDFIRWDGTDIKPVLEAMDILDDVYEYCVRQAARLFEEKNAA